MYQLAVFSVLAVILSTTTNARNATSVAGHAARQGANSIVGAPILRPEALPERQANAPEADRVGRNLRHASLFWYSGGKTWQEAFDTCAKFGARMPNREEMEAVIDRVNGGFAVRGPIWTSTTDSSGGATRGEWYYTYNLGNAQQNRIRSHRATNNTPRAVCMAPSNPADEILRMCPLGSTIMDYRLAGQPVQDCRGNNTPIGRFTCASFALSFSRCAQNRMGRKSWAVYSGCRPPVNPTILLGGTNGLATHVGETATTWMRTAHSTNVISIPASDDEHTKYCWLDPQHINPGFTIPNDNCWEQTVDTAPVIPPSKAPRLFCDGEPEGYLPVSLVQPAGYRRIMTEDGDYASDRVKMEHLQFKTGIRAEDLLPPP